MRKIKLLAPAVMLTLVAALTGCTRNDNPSNIDTSDKKVDHLIIKEVFYIGHLWEKDLTAYGMGVSRQLYDEDQYIEIYNPTQQTFYLDGLALAINALDPSQLLTFAPKDDITIRYFGMSSMAIFPGTGKDNPIRPGQSIIVAKYAIDHKVSFENEQIEGLKEDGLEDEEIKEELNKLKGYDKFLDLTKADFEWTYKKTSDRDRNNPNVPDLHPIGIGQGKPYHEFNALTEQCCLALIKVPWTEEDFLAHRLDTKKQSGYTHYINVTSSLFGDLYAVEIPFANVIDVVTICPKTTFQMKPCKLDKGYNSVSDLPSKNLKKDDLPKVSGLAITRKNDGKKFIDNDNSTFDFEVKTASLTRNGN